MSSTTTITLPITLPSAVRIPEPYNGRFKKRSIEQVESENNTERAYKRAKLPGTESSEQASRLGFNKYAEERPAHLPQPTFRRKPRGMPVTRNALLDPPRGVELAKSTIDVEKYQKEKEADAVERRRTKSIVTVTLDRPRQVAPEPTKSKPVIRRSRSSPGPQSSRDSESSEESESESESEVEVVVKSKPKARAQKRSAAPKSIIAGIRKKTTNFMRQRNLLH